MLFPVASKEPQANHPTETESRQQPYGESFSQLMLQMQLQTLDGHWLKSVREHKAEDQLNRTSVPDPQKL